MGITLMLVLLDQEGITINGIWTMGDERTNEVWFDDVFVPDATWSARSTRLPLHQPGARPRALHDVHDAPIKQRLDLLTEYVGRLSATAALRDDLGSGRMAQLHTDAEIARVMGLKFVARR